MAAGIATAAVLGLAAITLPALIVQWQTAHAMPPLTLGKLGIDQFQPISVALLAVAGAAGALVAGRGRWRAPGAATTLAFPILILVEIIADSTAHNLLPFELLAYGVLALPGLIAAGLTDWARGRLGGGAGAA